MPTIAQPHARGLALAAIGGMALTVDIPLIRLADGETWSILMVRSGVTLAATLAIWLALRLLGREPPALVSGWSGLAVTGLYALSSLAFMLAVYNTSTANLVFILAFNTGFAAILGWVFLWERPATATLAAIAAMLVGVAIIVWDGIGDGNFFGDAMACVTAFAIASALTISRRSGKDMGFAALIAVVPSMLIAAAFVSSEGYNLNQPLWIVLNGAIIMPVAFFCLANAPRYLSGPEVAMFYLLETVLAPVWVWAIFSEAPTTAGLIGGAILITALVAHSTWQLLEGRRRRATPVVRHPV